MANRYGEAALLAVQMRNERTTRSPEECWQRAVEKLYPTFPSAQRKSCPKGAFLGLCEAGMIRGIEPGHYTASSKNKGYAVQSIELLRAGTHKTVSQLWSAVAGTDIKTHNSQMDVVLALWKNGHIV